MKWQLLSPDTRINFEVTMHAEGSIRYKVFKEDRVLLHPSSLGIITDLQDFTAGLSFERQESQVIHEEYRLPHGNTSQYHNHANELTLHFIKNGDPMQVVIRAYDDGVAYRCRFPGSKKVLSEATGFTLPQDMLVNIWAQKFMKYYERTYDLYMLEHMKDEAFAFPLLIQAGTKDWMLITEAAVYGDYCASHVRRSNEDIHTFHLVFAPDQDGPIQTRAPFHTPWRVIVIGDHVDVMIHSNLVYHLNPPCELEDTSWIVPGRSAWSWYADGNSCGDLDIQKAYVDFASEFGWEYSLVDGGWERNALNVPELVQYAEPKNVGIWLWSHFRNLKTLEDCEAKLALWASWGIKGIKVDFFESDAQDTIQIYDLIAEIAAKYKLMVNYHGSTKPSGEQRRWPHVMTREGIYGAEYWRNISEGPNAVHNCTVPFTRNAVGSMDYTPVTFSRPTRTSYCHQLALSVIFESAVQNFADSKEAYRKSVTKSFLQKVPVAWDETILLEGYPGRFVTMARRKGEEWYIGAICAAAGRTVEIVLDFLENNVAYRAEIYEEVFGEGDDFRFRQATKVIVRTEKVTSEDKIRIPMKVYGGCAIRIVRDSVK